ncbi:MAG TPA: hypothetical protein VK894_04810 [Jiangellales bacterium]|nr:hypothetical protein [Jiangellales bacterium]
MKVGVHVVNFSLPGGPGSIAPTLAAVGEAADVAGVANLSLMGHYLQLGGIGRAEDPMLEGYTSLDFLAAHNATAELQLLVTGVTYRHPGLLAEIVSTLDVLSGGRADRRRTSRGQARRPRRDGQLTAAAPPAAPAAHGRRRRGAQDLRLVARYADACNLLVPPGGGGRPVSAKLDVLRRHRDTEGTDHDRIATTVL